MTDKIAGFLEVGTDLHGQVVINHPDLEPSRAGSFLPSYPGEKIA